VSVEWNDAYFVVREKLDIGPVLQHTVGYVVHEDNDQLILAHEIRSNDDWLDEEMDYTKVPKAMIVARVELGTVQVVKDEAAP
jgi:hypothetical protein